MAIRYTFRLQPDRDADLITWLNSLGDGERSCFIRNALRQSLKGTFLHHPSFSQNETYKIQKQPNQPQNDSLPEDTLKSKLDTLTQSF